MVTIKEKIESILDECKKAKASLITPNTWLDHQEQWATDKFEKWD